ncbi:hypothetical protein BDV10DRAFT_173940 [Aspergillus recurvatus]
MALLWLSLLVQYLLRYIFSFSDCCCKVSRCLSPITPALAAHAPRQLHLQDSNSTRGLDSMTTFPFRLTHTVLPPGFCQGLSPAKHWPIFPSSALPSSRIAASPVRHYG